MAEELSDAIQYLRDSVLEQLKETLHERSDSFLEIACNAFEKLWELGRSEEPLPKHLSREFLEKDIKRLISDIKEPGLYNSNGISVGIDNEGAYINFNCTYEVGFDEQIAGLIYLWEQDMLNDPGRPSDESSDEE